MNTTRSSARAPVRGEVASGGHSSLLDVADGTIRSLAETRDDAIGEVFDKVGKRVGLPFPQGPKVDLLAERGDVSRYRFRVRGVSDELFFSYSGLKSQTLRELEALERAGAIPVERRYQADDLDAVPAAICDLLAGFRDAAVRQIVNRLTKLHQRRPFQVLAVSGGVAANRLLRRTLEEWAPTTGVELCLVPLGYSGDNAAMIAFAALLAEGRGQGTDPRDVKVASRIPFASA